MTTTKIPLDLSQQDFLRFAMKQLGMGREEFARRVSLARHTLDRLLLPGESSEFRSLPEMGWSYIGEILKQDGKELIAPSDNISALRPVGRAVQEGTTCCHDSFPRRRTFARG